MSRYIDAGEAIEAVEQVVWDDCFWKDIEKAIKKIPTADVRENVHGRWVNGHCNQCGEHAPFWAMASTYYQSNFCPHCGAEMRTNNAPLADDNSIYG